MLRDARRLGDLAGRRAAIVLTSEQLAGRVEEQPPRFPRGAAAWLWWLLPPVRTLDVAFATASVLISSLRPNQ